MTKKKENIYLFEYNFLTIQLFNIAITVFIILLTVGIYKLCSFDFMIGFKQTFSNLGLAKLYIFFFIMVLWLILHEVIHGVSYILYGASYKNIKYGVVLEKGILYCKCGEYITKKNILWSVINPFIYIGVVTYLLGFAIESPLLILLSIINISGACADILMFLFFIKRDKDMRFKEIKDSSTFVLKTTEDLSNRKFFAVKLKEELKDDEFKEKDKLITISKPSKIILIILGILFGLCLILSFFIG